MYRGVNKSPAERSSNSPSLTHGGPGPSSWQTVHIPGGGPNLHVQETLVEYLRLYLNEAPDLRVQLRIYIQKEMVLVTASIALPEPTSGIASGMTDIHVYSSSGKQGLFTGYPQPSCLLSLSCQRSNPLPPSTSTTETSLSIIRPGNPQSVLKRILG